MTNNGRGLQKIPTNPAIFREFDKYKIDAIMWSMKYWGIFVYSFLLQPICLFDFFSNSYFISCP